MYGYRETPESQPVWYRPMYGYPVDTGRKTPEGRPVWYSPFSDPVSGHPGGHYSEWSETVPYMGGWMTQPTVTPSGGFGGHYGPVDYTGERMPAFKTQDEAVRYAKMRSRLR